MNQLAWIQLFLYVFLLIALAYPLGIYMMRIYEGKPPFLMQWLLPLERLIYCLCHIHPEKGMCWKRYGLALVLFNLFGFCWVYGLEKLQLYLPLNPQHVGAVETGLAINTAISYVTNTNWQSYAGETTMSYLTQMLALTSQNFLSAASGMALLMALIRSFIRQREESIGHFWVDVTRSTLYILLPLSCVLAMCLITQGVIQTFKPPVSIHLIQPTTISNAEGHHESIEDVLLPLGPVASQVAIKQLGSNGGGFFNANAAHPFENPTPMTNFLEMIAILLIPAACCISFGLMVGDNRQGLALLVVMLIWFVPSVCVTTTVEQQGNPSLNALGLNPHGNMEGKEVRFGIFSSTLWSVATTASANGSVNAMLDSYTPIGGFVPLWMMHLGEIIFGGVGSGLYSMIMVVIIAVFIAGLMVGRTPEYLGKKIDPFEMKMASIAILIMPICVLLSTAVSLLLPSARASLLNSGAHGLTEMLYAFTSLLNNNGSAFAGLHANTPYFNFLGSLLMLMGRYAVAMCVLAVAGSLLEKRIIPSNLGTLQTHTPLFIVLLLSVILLLGALSFLPVLAFGPIAEALIHG